jgi:hypothetical protein
MGIAVAGVDAVTAAGRPVKLTLLVGRRAAALASAEAIAGDGDAASRAGSTSTVRPSPPVSTLASLLVPSEAPPERSVRARIRAKSEPPAVLRSGLAA